uniref:Acyl-CoA dehydrogenase 6 n=1 Tax=Romanomermis culicivorax TaxID=13658 RepID=A0A915I733_ROMCU
MSRTKNPWQDGKDKCYTIKTTAKTSGDDLIINGSKMWITNGCQADWMCLLANTNPGEKNPHKNKSLICLPMKTRGVTVSRNIKKLGLNCSDTAEIFFEDVHVTTKNIIGQKGMGFFYLMLQFQIERLWAVAASLLPLERAIRLTIEYARDRKLCGRTVLDSQVIKFRLAEMQTEIELLRSLLYRAVAAHLNGEDVTKFASMCKLKSGRLSREVADSCLQIWGGMGFAHESPISRMYRDCRVISIAGGSDEVMLSIICKYMNILSKF